MEYYHGTNNENIIVYNNKQKKKKSDFGGLDIYATTLIDQAKEWSCKNSVNEVKRHRINFSKNKNMIIRKGV